ncbi:MAG: beta-galactosidase [Phycisphaeraceae bacterium]
MPIAFAAALLAWPAVGLAEPTTLFDFETPGVMTQVGGIDTARKIIELNGSRALEVATGVDKPYPNITLKPTGQTWNLDRFTRIEIDVTNLSDESLKIGARADNPGATGRSNSTTGSIGLDPGETGTLTVEFDRKFAQELRASLKGMHHTPWGVRGQWGGVIDPAQVTQISLFLNKPDRPYRFAIDNLRAAGTFDPSTLVVPEPFFPFIDRFGQYVHRDWPGKVKSEADLAAHRQAEAKEMDSMPRPSQWNRYGGWADGPQLQATGHFRTHKHEGKWYLVDPEGRLFFSIGIDCVRPGGLTPVTEDRAGWFADPPWETDAALKAYLVQANTNRRNEYDGKPVPAYGFFNANAHRKYGPEWQPTWRDLIGKRLINWGFNTIGNWSDPELLPNAGLPYTHWVYINAPKLPWQAGTRNRISDPFHPGLEPELRRRAEGMTKGTTDDPNCIGYFVDNELSWGDATYLARGVVKGEPAQPAKVAMVEDLKARYGTIDKLNAAWAMEFAAWDDVLASKVLPTTDAAAADLELFNEQIVRAYFKTVRQVMKSVAPDKLYLGCRFAESNPQVVRVAAEYCDVVSFNLYRETVMAWRPPAPGNGAIDKPVIIGEFHFGASDRGVFGQGLVHADNAPDRARKFARYAASAARNPLIVGAHWFQLVDEPASGRTLEGENHGIGFLDITDTPYPEMIQASRDVAARLYDLRAQSKQNP